MKNNITPRLQSYKYLSVILLTCLIFNLGEGFAADDLSSTGKLTYTANGALIPLQKEQQPQRDTANTQKGYVDTYAGRIAYITSEGDKAPIIFIHGNSSVKEVFKKQFEALGSKYKLIAFDLPGHGESENALTHEEVYSFPGYAKVIIEVLEKLEIKEAIFCGWSLGGHIAIELLNQKPDLMAGLLITGTPPIPLTQEGIQNGFHLTAGSHLTSQKEPFSPADARQYLTASGFNPDQVPDFIAANMRTDGNARHLMIKSVVEGVGANAKEVLELTQKPLTIIIGKKDPLIKNEYIEKSIQYNSLWDIYSLNCGHAPHWEMPTDFNNILDQFAQRILGD